MAQALLTFLLVSVVGTALALYLQHFYWLRQQRFLGQEKEYIELRGLFPSISGAIGSRLYRSKRLHYALNTQVTTAIDSALADYDATVVKWNEALGTYYANLTMYVDYSYTRRLEDDIHGNFQKVGLLLEAAVRYHRTGIQVSRPTRQETGKIFRRLDAEVSQFNRNLLRSIDEKRKALYFGRKLMYIESNLDRFSKWELIKSLFISNVDTHAILCAPADPRFPRLPFFKWPRVY
jgi:hypothetical protein